MDFCVLLLIVVTLWILFSRMRKSVDLKKFLSGKRVVVTGGGTGIGREVARLACEYGAKVIIVGRRVKRLESAVEDIKNTVNNPMIDYMSCDCAEQEDCKNLIAEAVRKWGGLDILVLNHTWTRVQRLMDIPEKEISTAFNDTYDTNVKGNLFLMHYAIPELQKSKGHLLSVSSLSVYGPCERLTLYCSSKSAMESIIRVLRLELEDNPIGITVCVPGIVKTEAVTNYLPQEEIDKGTDPLDCAREMWEALARGEREHILRAYQKPIPISGNLVYYLSVLFPALIDKLTSLQLKKFQSMIPDQYSGKPKKDDDG